MNKRYNLVLSGGGSRGYAHVGALEALLEKGMQINALSATSAGALIGAFVCDGFHPSEIKEIILREEPKVSFNLMGITNGLLSLEAVTKFIKKHLRSKCFEDFRIPFYVSATNLKNGQQVIFNEGPVLDVLLAASAIPVLFPPVQINSVPFADGGIVNNLPVEPFVNKPLPIIAVHVNPLGDYNPDSSIKQILDRSIHLALRTSVMHARQHCDLFIEPPLLSAFHLFESKRTKEIMQVGYDYVIKNVELKP